MDLRPIGRTLWPQGVAAADPCGWLRVERCGFELGAGVPRPLAGAALLSLVLGCIAASDGPFWASQSSLRSAGRGPPAQLCTGGTLGDFLAPVITPYIASLVGLELGLNARKPDRNPWCPDGGSSSVNKIGCRHRPGRSKCNPSRRGGNPLPGGTTVSLILAGAAVALLEPAHSVQANGNWAKHCWRGVILRVEA